MTEASLPRPEYPRPQLQRQSWINLNGAWTFEFDPGRSGLDAGRELYKRSGFGREILVPFCPESSLSGVGHKDFIEAMWYHRKISIPQAWAGQRVLLHFGGVDYESEVFIDGRAVGMHFGGTVSFTHDITPFVKAGGTHDLVVRVLDETRVDGAYPRGKQCSTFKSHGCVYTRTTGIWQTVWLEAVDLCGLRRVQIVPDLDGRRFVVSPEFFALTRGLRFRARLLQAGRTLAEAEAPAAQGGALVLPVDSPRPWCPADPFLYDLSLAVLDADGRERDAAASYAGLRKVHIEGNRFFLNNEATYLRLVLDQGFYPDGIWTAATDAALRRDIELSQQAGFNGARLHQKVFEERFHYWADRLGYLTWGESASWGCDVNSIAGARNFTAEWREIVTRDRNHPSIIAWTPFNETAHMSDPKQHRRLHRDMYDLCKDLDPTRPVNDSSGYLHVKTDLWTVHTYEQDPARLAAQLAIDPQKGVFRCIPDRECAYGNQPYLVDEYGGIKWIPPERQAFADNSWGYGGAPTTVEEFHARLEGLTDAILNHEHISGYCYTQLTDVEQEQNGIYNYDRTSKFDAERIARVFRKNPPGWRA